METIGLVLGFDVVGVHRFGPGLRVDVGAGDVRMHNKQRHYPVAWYADASVPAGAKQARVYFVDPELAANTFPDGSSGFGNLHIDYDTSTPRGVYTDGLVVVAIVDVPPMDRRTRAQLAAAAGLALNDDKAKQAAAMAEVRAEFERWQVGEKNYENDADFARKVWPKHADIIKSDASIRNACTRWRKARKSSC